jgi:hypothetical protein
MASLAEASDVSHVDAESSFEKLQAFYILHGIFFTMALPAHSGPRPLIQFRNHFHRR